MALTAQVWLSDAVVRRVAVRGHAGFGAPGEDPVCAAVTLLVRSAARDLAGSSALRVVGSAPKEGAITFEILEYDTNAERWLAGVSSLLLQGLRDLASEGSLRLVEHNYDE